MATTMTVETKCDYCAEVHSRTVDSSTLEAEFRALPYGNKLPAKWGLIVNVAQKDGSEWQANMCPRCLARFMERAAGK